MPTLTLKVYCDDEPENLKSFKARAQKALQTIDEQFIIAMAEYSEDEGEILEAMLPGCVLSAPLELIKK